MAEPACDVIYANMKTKVRSEIHDVKETPMINDEDEDPEKISVRETGL
jgi:hypothetical protein